MSGMTGYGQGHPSGTPTATPPAPLGRSRRRGGWVFTVVLSVLMLLGAGVMALVLLASSAPNALVVGVLLAALPVGPLVAAFLWLDRYEPEPTRLLVLAFGWGALVATAAALILQAVDQVVFGTAELGSAAIVAPITEEAAKGLFVVLLLWVRRHEIDGVLDGLVYAGLVGVGFAFTENILYLGAAFMGGAGMGPGGIESALGVFVVRGIFSPFAHPLFTAFIGIGVGYAVHRQGAGRFLAPAVGYVLAVLAHGAWNGAAFFGGGQYFALAYLFLMVPAFLLVVGFAVWARSREARMLSRALDDAAMRGFLTRVEVPWLVRLGGRRASRRHARQVGGPVAEQVMADYQQAAVELGFLHDRFLRGTAPADFAERGTAIVQRMAALRPYLLFPPAVGDPAAGTESPVDAPPGSPVDAPPGSPR
jgi:RsiW-degrading membrane proteinase PrsW (M82 family)